MKSFFLLIFTGLALCSCFSGLAGEKKTLVYMLDGIRADKMECVSSPIWNQLKNNTWADGYRSQWSVDATNDPMMPPNSAPNHAAIATGRSGDAHKVLDNKYFWKYDSAAAPVFLQTLHQKLGIPVSFVFNWGPDKFLIPECPALIFGNADEKNSERLLAALRQENAPDAILVFDDAPDVGGHRTGFYPFGEDYKKLSDEAVKRIENLLTTIKNRPDFAKEDWLIVICSDHGGNGQGHGMKGGQASTVPLLFCSKNLQPGKIAGRPNNLSIAPMVFRHFGLEEEAAKLPGDCKFRIVEDTPVNGAPLYDLTVQDGKITNAGEGKFSTHGNLPVSGDSFDLSEGGYLTLDDLRGRAEKPFSFAITLEFNPDNVANKTDPALFSNKDWRSGQNPGFIIFLREKDVRANFKRTPETPNDYIFDRPGRADLYGFRTVAGKKTVIAGSIGKNGVITLFQKHPDQQKYWYSLAADGIVCASGLDWNIGQDGTGKFGLKTPAKISRFRFWDHALTTEELQSLTD